MIRTRWRNHIVTSLIAVLVACPPEAWAKTARGAKALTPVMATTLCTDGRTMGVSTNTSQVALFDVTPLQFRLLLTDEKAKTRVTRIASVFKSPPIACSPDSKLLVAAAVIGELVGWEIDSGSVRFRAPVQDGIVGLAFFPDGHSFVSVGPLATQWSAENGSRLGEFEAPGGATATSVAVSPDGQVVLIGLSNGEIAEFDASTRGVLRLLKGHAAPVTGIAFSPDGSAFMSAAGRFDPRIWKRTETSPQPHSFSEVGGMGESLDKTGRRGRAGAEALLLFTWLLGTARGFQVVGAPTMGAPPVVSESLGGAATEPSPYCRTSVAYSPDGRFLAATAHLSLLSGEFQLMLADMARNEGHIIKGTYGCSVAFTRDSKFVVTGGLRAPQIRNAETGIRVRDGGGSE